MLDIKLLLVGSEIVRSSIGEGAADEGRMALMLSAGKRSALLMEIPFVLSRSFGV